MTSNLANRLACRLYFVSLRRAEYGGYVYAETTGDYRSDDFAVVAYLSEEAAEEAAKKFPGSEVVETSLATDSDWQYRPLMIERRE